MQDNNMNKYRVYRQNQIIDNTVKALLAEKEIDNSGNAVIEMTIPTGTFKLTIQNYAQLKGYISNQKYSKGMVNQTTPKLLEALLIKISTDGFNSFSTTMTINEFAGLIGKKDKSKLRKRTNVDLQILKNTMIKFNNKKEYCFYLCDEKTHMERNKIIFGLSKELFTIIKKQKNFLYIPVDLLQTNERTNPHTYLLYKKILSSKRINCGNEQRENRIKVKELYNYCSTLPKYEEILNNGGQVSQRIIEPFERDLNSITKFNWKYENTEFKSFNEWLETIIDLEWLEELPGLESVLDGRNKFKEEQVYAKEKALVQIEKSKLKRTNDEVKKD